MSSSRSPGGRPPDPLPPVRNGWRLYAWPEFQRQFGALVAEVEKLREKDPAGYASHPRAKLLAAVLRLTTEIIPADPSAEAFRQGNTLGAEHRHWFRARFYQRFRLFFRFHSGRRIIVYAWMNDESSLRKSGSRNDPYSVFRRKLESGSPPGDFDELLAESAGMPVGPAPDDPEPAP